MPHSDHSHTASLLPGLGASMLALLLATPLPASAQEGVNMCGRLDNAYGPYDFRHDRDKLPIVLGAHFTPMVEALIRGTTSQRPGADIDYTLRAIPNHPNALLSMARLADRERTDQPVGSRYTVDCWFDRAIRFRPDDHVVRMLYANFLTEKKRSEDALRQLEIVRLQLAKDNPLTHYNLGLLYLGLQIYDKALVEAHQALALGYPRTELQEKLRAAGRWKEPGDDAAAEAASAPASGAASEPSKS
ncbi:ABC transporter permease [Roseateles microcysteis]|uniref:ABC transporter permease n=1 Tax=Roseateles microcysteis TaxID=3119057 RepID=UPI002FE5A43E